MAVVYILELVPFTMEAWYCWLVGGAKCECASVATMGSLSVFRTCLGAVAAQASQSEDLKN